MRFYTFLFEVTRDIVKELRVVAMNGIAVREYVWLDDELIVEIKLEDRYNSAYALTVNRDQAKELSKALNYYADHGKLPENLEDLGDKP